MARSWKHFARSVTTRQRRRLRESEAAFILLATLSGLIAGLLTTMQAALAHGIQHLLYGVTINRLSALGSIHHPWRLLALPLGGLCLVLLAHVLRHRTRAPIDVVEANALHGGRIPFVDNLVIAAQTILSNGAGASVGLEAAYAQIGGGVASFLGQQLKLRRSDLRNLVGAGAGAAVGAAFGAPLTGAFYAFEIVIGAYTPAAIAPVVAAALAATFVTRSLGADPYLIATTANRLVPTTDYLIYAMLGLVCAIIGIAIMRLVTFAEMRVQSWSRLGTWRPVVGGCLLIPVAWLSPQALSAGHGALHLDLALHPTITFLLIILAVKIIASIISLSFGFRGGLFFASLFLGSLIGQIFAGAFNTGFPGLAIDANDAALVGMAALSVSIVGGPMTLAMLMLETTHDFTLMGPVLTASLIASAFTRETFGYSFSTWRLHIRGSSVRSPRDIGWVVSLTASRLMRKDWVSARDILSIGEFRALIPLGSASKAISTDAEGRYLGIIPTAAAYDSALSDTAMVRSIASLAGTTLAASADIHEILQKLDQAGADELAVVDDHGVVIGIVTEKHARRRYFEEVEAAQRRLFGES
ncbi:chloride channel protein [Sphingomonas sp. 28-63-12]|uniref:chloride channel protein n=1 Tax=Sphingomonas sp. 28-63-12 TaxID=1970434 RepID=UPI000BD7914F|nr:MAG: chloride channel protein [Sphingomonas sp. 28-63-12]